MDITKRVAVIGFLCLGTSALSFGEVFQSLDAADWNAAYNSNTALFGATVQQDGFGLQSGFPDGATAAILGLTADTPQSFTLTYDPGTGNASLTIGSASLNVPTLTRAPAGGTLDHIGIQLGTASDDESVTLSNLILNGTADGGSLSSAGAGLFDFAMTPSADLTGSVMTLTGDITMNWSGGAPGAAISAEIVGADTVLPPVPEPGTGVLLGSSLLGLGLLRRKRTA